MSGDATETFIDDASTASSSLAAMHALAQELETRLASITARIRRIETEKPWGHAEEYGGAFEQVYNAGPVGADFIAANAVRLAASAAAGADAARAAVAASAGLDHSSQNRFKR